MATLIGDPKLVARAKALRKKSVDGKPMSYAAIARSMHLRDNKAAWVLVNDKPGMDRAPKGNRGAKVAKATKAKGAKRPVTKAKATRRTAARQTRRAA